jgi:uncharacterized protein YjbI with pentapeptide repeats
MIYWIQEATIAGAQGATPSWLNALLGAGVVGAVVGFIGLILAQLRHTQTLRQTRELEDKRAREIRELEDKRARETRELEAQRAHEAALQRYFEHVGNLLVEQPLRDATLGDTLSTVARAQTLAVLEGLDPDRKRILLQFLYESHLIDAGEAVVSLAGANLGETNLERAILRGANLTGANLTGANLVWAELTSANLRGAYLGGAKLGGAYLGRAYLGGAVLVGANLERAILEGANLERANLTGANLLWAESLTQEQIYGATGDENTKLPDHLQRPAHWSKGDEGQPKEG